MLRFALLRPLALLLALGTVAACSSSGSPSSGLSMDERKALIISNLTFEFPQIAASAVTVDSLGPTDIEGLDAGVFSVDGSPGQPFLVTSDNRRLYLLATDPIDAGRSDEEIETARAGRAAAAATEVADRAAALREATAELPSKGPAEARVTIVEFSDFQCGYCRLAANTVETLLQRYPKDVRVVYAHFPLSNHPWATPAAVAATCAAEQSPAAFWTLHDTYFRDQGAFTVANVSARSRAALAGAQIDLDAWDTCATDTASPAYQEALAAVQQQTAFGDQLGVTGTPGFFVNGRFVNGNQPIPVFVEAIDAALADAQ